MNPSSLFDSGDCFRAVAFDTYPASNTTEILVAANGQVVRATGYKTAFVLRLCSEPKPLAEHVAFVADRLGVADRQPLAQLVHALATAGLLQSMNSVRSELAALPSGIKNSGRITTVGALTADRPAALERCLQSYSEHFLSKGVFPNMLVIDDSRGSDSARRNRELCVNAGATGISVGYIGIEEKAIFCRALEAEGIPRHVLQFGIPIEPITHSPGANRNFLLLATVGEEIFSVDDDTECRPWLHPHAEKGVTITGHDDPTEIWPFADRNGAFSFATQQDINLLHEHEGLLGQSLAHLLNAEHGERAYVDNICQHYLSAALQDAQAHTVRVSISGMAGDSGMYSARRILFATGGTRARLANDESLYRLALHSRELARAVPQASVSHSGICIAMAIGLDNREPLPPFMPNWRNQDGVFSSTLTACDPHALIAHARAGIWHNAFRQSHYTDDVFTCARRTRVSELLMLLITSCTPAIAPALGMTRMELLARYLIDLGRMGCQEFASMMRRALIEKRCRQLATHRALATAQFAYPSFWLSDLERYREETMKSLVDEPFPHIEELQSSTPHSALTYVQQYAVAFGELLLWWPRVMSASISLKRRGISFSR